MYDDLRALGDAFGDAEWILHAASQDIPCLREVGLVPTRLFDTELAARLLGYPRVGLATLVEVIMGQSMRKEHSAVDWSKRPLPKPWLEYAALDVEVLLELREVIGARLEESGKTEWAAQEFQHLIDHVPPPRQDPWRRTSGIHKAKGRRCLAAVRELWTMRDEIAQQRDTTPGRLIPDSALIAAANAMPTSTAALLDTPGFHGRGARRYADRWLGALERARKLRDTELPPLTIRTDGPPAPRVWAERDPVAAARLATARVLITAFAEERQVPVENLLTPDYLRRVLWKPPAADSADMETAVGEELATLGARPWQIEITAPILTTAILDPKPAKAPEQSPGRAPSRRLTGSAGRAADGLVDGVGAFEGSKSGTDASSIASSRSSQRQDHRLVEELRQLSRRQPPSPAASAACSAAAGCRAPRGRTRPRAAGALRSAGRRRR